MFALCIPSPDHKGKDNFLTGVDHARRININTEIYLDPSPLIVVLVVRTHKVVFHLLYSLPFNFLDRFAIMECGFLMC